MNEKIKMIVRHIFSSLAAGDFTKIAQLTKGIRMSGDEIKTALHEYGKTLCIPPEDAFHLMDVVQIKNASIPKYSVRMPFWTKEEGRSDLTLELTITITDKNTEVELDDIRVL